VRDLPFSRIQRFSSGRRGLPELRDKLLAVSVYLFVLLLVVPTAEDASRKALKERSRLLSGPPEDWAAFQNFAEDLQSPKQVLEDFVKSDLDGGRLTEKGRSDLSRFFTQGSEPQKEDKIVIVSPEYDLRETASAGDRAKFQLQYRHFYGKLGSALNFEPAADKASNGVPIKEGILSSFVLVRLFSPILHQTVSAEWRIDGPAPPICISLATAIRYVKEAKERATDPTLKKNADQTLAKLMKLH
jgi:hypothetical protein